MFGDMCYPVTEVALDPGDLVVAYTDGVTEAVDDQDNEFTEDGLEASVRARLDDACPGILSGIVADVEMHALSRSAGRAGSDNDDADPTTSVPLGDDLTLVLLRRVE